jgi:hypothetical protein
MPTFAVGFLTSSLASGLVGPSLVFALATTLVDSTAPSAIEQALIERACTGTQSIGPNGDDANALCLDARLLALRSEFGRDLSRLSTAERRKLDSTCSRFQTTRGREAYLDCLHAELASLSARRNRGSVSAAAETVAAAADGASPSDAASSSPQSAPSSSSFPLRWVVAILVVVAGAVAGVVFTLKARTVRHTCRACNVQVPGPGDLCPACRHDAAEALRRAAAERDERQRAQEEEERRQRDEAEAQRQQKERAEAEARVQRLEEARLRDEARQREEALVQQEADGRRGQVEELPREPGSLCDEREAAFDPYAVLGLSSDATGEQVRAAFEAARTKYDPEQVAHLGDDVQTHYAAKSRAAERAYQMLAGEVEAPAAANSVSG